MNILSIDEAKKFAHGKKVVIITGVTGQDGSFMVDYLLKHTDCEIFGGARRLSVTNHENLDHLVGESRFHLINFDLTDAHSISQIVSQLNPDYFINFAAQSFVKSSWDFPAQTWDTNTKSLIHILEAIRLHSPNCRFYNAGSSEEFGDVSYSPQDEAHPLKPRSPYGASKAAARQIVKVYRESYGLYAIQGWLFNHEGTRRGEEFVTRKITKGVARIAKAMSDRISFEPLELGNIDVCRDWSDAEDCVIAVWKMLNQEVYNLSFFDFTKGASGVPIVSKELVTPMAIAANVKEYVVSSNETHSVREFVQKAFAAAGLKGSWNLATDPLQAEFHIVPYFIVTVKINRVFYRPAEVELLWGNSDKIRTELGWVPQTSFDALVKKMVKNDIDRLK